MKKPKLFTPTIKNQVRIGKIIAKSLQKNKAVAISNGKSIQGTKII